MLFFSVSSTVPFYSLPFTLFSGSLLALFSFLFQSAFLFCFTLVSCLFHFGFFSLPLCFVSLLSVLRWFPFVLLYFISVSLLSYLLFCFTLCFTLLLHFAFFSVSLASFPDPLCFSFHFAFFSVSLCFYSTLLSFK